MSVARRPLLTATAAGSLLCALWFVPSANATAEQEAGLKQQTGTGAVEGNAPEQATENLRLAETGSVNTTPYLIAGTAFLGIGTGFVAYSVRRRDTATA